MILTAAERIAAKIDAMPGSERRAAQALIANYPLLGLKTVADFSAQAGVSSPTILRFVSRLGFQSYSDFQNALQDELAARLQSPMIRSAAGAGADAASSDPLVDAAIDNIRETFHHLTAPQIADIVADIANLRARVFLIGGRFTDPIARYMAAHLSIVRPGVFHLAGQENNWRDRLIDMAKPDLLVVFDIRRYQDSLLRFSEKAHQKGVRVLLVTDQWLSPIARVSRHVVAARTGVPSPWDSNAALFVAAEALIAAVTKALGPKSAQRIADLEALRD